MTALCECSCVYPALQPLGGESFGETNVECLNFTDCVYTAFALGASTRQGNGI